MKNNNIEIKYENFYFYWTLLMISISAILFLSASSTYSLNVSDNFMFYFYKHTIKIFIGVLIFLIIPLINYKFLSSITKQLLICSWFIMILGYYMKSNNDSTARWLSIAGYNLFQTSDIAKVALIIFTAGFINKYYNKINNPKVLMIEFLPYFIITITLIYFQPDFSTSIIITSIITIMLLIAGLSKKYIIYILLFILLIIGIVGLSKFDYQINRLLNWPSRIMFPMHDSGLTMANDQQIKYSIIALANGGLFGLGLGNSFVKNNFLSEGYTDFIFPIISEELGFIGATCLLFFCFGSLFHKSINFLKHVKDRFGFFLIIGFISMYLNYFLTHIGYCIGLLPTTGLPLPFISYGGTNMIINLFSMGLIISIVKFNRTKII